MALLSVKRFLTQLEEEAAYRRVISMLLEAVATHALNLDGDACRSFRERIGEVRLAMTSETTVEELLGDAGAAVQAIGDYARETSSLISPNAVSYWATAGRWVTMRLRARRALSSWGGSLRSILMGCGM